MRFVRSTDSPEEESEGNSWNWFHKAGMWEQSQNSPHDQHPRVRTKGRPETKLAGLAAMLVPSTQGHLHIGKGMAPVPGDSGQISVCPLSFSSSSMPCWTGDF